MAKRRKKATRAEAEIRRQAILDKMANMHGVGAADIAAAVQEETGIPCTRVDVWKSAHMVRENTVVENHAPPPPADIKEEIHHLQASPSKFEDDIARVHEQMEVLGLSDIVIRVNGEVTITKVQRETFRIQA